MSWKVFRFILSMIPVFWSSVKDLLWEELSFGEIRTNYLFGKANAFDRAHFLKKAAGVYQEILAQEPSSIAAYLSLGGLYYRGERYERAIPCYEKVIQLNPKHYQAHYWLARCFWKLERYYAAINTLEEVIEFLPTFRDALNLIGECYERIGEGAKAEHFCLKAISSDRGGVLVHGSIVNRSAPEKRGEERIKH